MRKSKAYRAVRTHKTRTQPVKRAIGESRRPEPEGQPGFIRIDTVNQGDKDGVKGLCHTNAVDEVTQFQVVCAAEKISETCLIPVLEGLLASFLFKLQGFHSDNGVEYVNHRVAKLLGNLHIKFTKSRSRKTNFLTPYLNYHRPCFYAETIIDKKGKEKKKYRYANLMTPFEKLKSLPGWDQYLEKGTTPQALEAEAESMSDNEAAQRLHTARESLFKAIFERKA